MGPWLTELRRKAGRLKTDVYALYLAARHPTTPWYAKILLYGIVAYALSPVNLIPDFILIVGYLDDVILIPLGIALAIRIIPNSILVECRQRAQDEQSHALRIGRWGAVAVVILWLVASAWGARWIYRTV